MVVAYGRQESKVENLCECRDSHNMMLSVVGSSLVICALAWATLPLRSFAAESSPAKNVLVLESFTDRNAVKDPVLLKSTVRSHVAGPVNFQVEFLESERFGTARYEAGLSDSLASMYAGKLDLVIANSYPALRFAVDHRNQIFPGVPIIFMAVATSRFDGSPLWSDVTGVTINSDVHGTVDLALRLHPDTKNAVVIAGSSEFEQYWLKITDQELRLHESKLKTIDLVGIQPDELLKEVAALSPHTIIFFQQIPLESAQPVTGTYDVLVTLAKQFPTYCIHNYCLDRGAVGGSYPDYEEQEVMAGGLAARILSGEKPESIPVLHSSAARALVDWRQLQRWNISEAALPVGTIVVNRQPTAWDRHKKYIMAGIALVVVQSLLIIGLLLQRARKRRVETRLRESEERFRLMADTTPSLIWMSDKDGKVTYLNNRRIEFTGLDPATGFENVWRTFIHPDDLQKVQAANSQGHESQKAYSKEYRLRRHDGVYRWMFDLAAPRINDDGSFAGFIGSAIDISDQKQANEALESISGKLIEAQEKERSRIARELHDDICQRLALLSLELERESPGSGGFGTPAQARMEEIRGLCVEIADDVQALSHELHSSKLDYLGVEAAIRSFCHEFSQQHHVNVEFTSKSVPNPLPRDISLSLFRVTQEALHNAVKYSGVDRFTVDLRSVVDNIQLEIKDSGAGFQLQEAKQNGGLGLVSMQERIHLVKGIFTVESRVNSGTTILAHVPFHTET